MSAKYLAEFDIPGWLEGNVEVPAIENAKEGFWVNHDHEFTTGSDCWIWVAPSSISCVVKVDRDDD